MESSVHEAPVDCRKVMAVRPHIGSSISSTLPMPSRTRQATGDSTILPLAKLRQQQAVTIDVCEITSISSSISEQGPRYFGPICYIKHNNLDVRPLTFQERFRLARLHYFTIPNFIRWCLLLLFLAWFICSASKVLKEYRQHDTVVYMEYRDLNRSPPPAVTFCTQCILCAVNATEVLYAEELMKNDLILNMLEVNGSDSDGSPDIEIKCHLYNSTKAVSSEQQQAQKCEDLAPVVVSFQRGHRCLTWFSDIYGHMSRLQQEDPTRAQLVLEEFPLIRFTLHGRFLNGRAVFGDANHANSFNKSSWGNFSEGHGGIAYAGMYFTLTDAAVLPDMFSLQYYKLRQSKIAVVAFTKRIEQLQPPPYATRCVQYRTSRLDMRPDELDVSALQGSPNSSTDLSLYRSRGECFTYCMMRVLYSARPCLNLFTIITLEMVQQAQYYQVTKWLKEIAVNSTRHEKDISGLGLNYDDADFWVKFCPRSPDMHQAFLEARQHCLDVCPNACLIETYSEKSVFNFDLPGNHTTNSSIVEIVWAYQPATFVKHKIEMDSTEMLGSVGGAAHVHLGVSVLYLLNYIIRLIKWGEFLPNHTCCCVVTWWRSCFVRRMDKRPRFSRQTLECSRNSN